MKQTILTIMALLLAAGAFGQGVTLEGNVVNSATGEPLQGVAVGLRGSVARQVTGPEGYFRFTDLLPGDDIVSFSSPEIISREFMVSIGTSGTSLGEVRVVVIPRSDEMSYVTIMDEISIDDDVEGSASQDISSLVILSNDIYLNTINWQLSPLYFKVRGYESRYEQKYINGVLFNDQMRGVFNYAAIGALNDMTRNGDDVTYNNAGKFTFGTIGGAQNINMRAGSYAPGTKLTASYTNSNYYLRGMVTYSTGLRDDGWAFTLSAGGRWSDEGYIKGTFYNNFAYGLSVERQLEGGRHSISFTTFGSPVKRGQASASVQEAYDLTGSNLYNPNWGYQNGKKRNARVVNSYDPTGILSHIFRINESMTLTTGLGVHYNRYGRSSLNWYNAPDPRPDYYRYLPSYYDGNDYIMDYYTDLWRSNDTSVTQIDWDRLYERNSMQADGKALYMVEEQRSDLFEGTFNSTLNVAFNDRFLLNAGVGARYSRAYQFKTVLDLMGAQYVLDVDKFAERDMNAGTDDKQNDLNRPNRKVYKGDRFGYDFSVDIKSADAWISNEYNSRIVDWDYSAKISFTEFQRYGKMRNGHYPDNSYGWGKRHNFVDFGFKTSLLFKITGRHLVRVSGGYETNSPLPNDSYNSIRISDNTPGELKSGRIVTVDASYIFSLPAFSGRVSAFQTNFYDQVRRTSYYWDSQRTFVNHILTGVSMVNRGIELGAKYKVNNNLSFTAAGTYAQYYYSNNPTGTISYENGLYDDVYEKVYLKDYYVGQTPQFAGTVGANLFYNYWFLDVYFNGFTNNYIDVSPMRKLASNFVNVNPNDENDLYYYQKMTGQEMFGGGATLDVSLGKMLYLRGGRQLNFNATIKNVLNRKNIVRGGFEQGRTIQDYPDRFASKYYYMQGVNAYVNLSYRF